MRSASPSPTRRHDGKLILALLATSLGLAYGVWYAYSVILVALLDEFGWSRSVLAGAFSLFAVVQGLSNPILGHLCDRFHPALLMACGGVVLGAALLADSWISQPWHLYLGFGFMTALGGATCGWTPAVVQVQRRFQHRLGLALGIVGSGIGVGMLVVVPLVQYLIDAYGWRFAFRALAILCSGMIVPSALYLYFVVPAHVRLRDRQPDAPIDPRASVTVRQATRMAPFWLMVVAYFCGSVCSQTLHVHQVVFLVDHGIAAITAASVVGLVGASSVVGKTGGGWLSDRIEREVVFVAGIAILVSSIYVLHLAGKHGSVPLSYLFAVMLGVGYSATATLVPAMVSDRFRGPNFGSILGVGLLGSAMGSATGPWLAGHLFDLTGSYSLPFLIAAVSGVLSGAAAWIARGLRRRPAGLGTPT